MQRPNAVLAPRSSEGPRAGGNRPPRSLRRDRQSCTTIGRVGTGLFAALSVGQRHLDIWGYTLSFGGC